MKKWLLYAALIGAVALLAAKPSAGTDIGMLQPVQVVCLSRTGDDVSVQTDTGDWGTGKNLRAAVEHMKAGAAGEVFLDTADHLLLSPDCQDLLSEADGLLRPSCTVCYMEGQPDLERIGQFLRHHTPAITLMGYRAGRRDLQTLLTEDGRMTLVS